MRHKISWSDLPGQRVGVWGLGVEGRSTIGKLATLAVEPAVLVDDDPTAGGHDVGKVTATADGGLAHLETCDVVIKAPGISRYRDDVARLERCGVAVVGGLGLWLQEADLTRVACVTGTKGKSTTSSIAGHLLRGLGATGIIAGNIGLPPYDPTITTTPDYWLIETSSYQATDLAVSPPVVAVTSLHPDHLDWHHGTENYFRDKLSACSLPGAQTTIANGDSDLLRQREELLGPHVTWVRLAEHTSARWPDALGLLGDHNRRNALIAAAVLQALGVPGAHDEDRLHTAAGGYNALLHRLQVVADVDGVTFVDDTLSTNVLPTLAALAAFPTRRVALIAGGHDRHIDYRPLAEGLRHRTLPTLVLTVPDNGPRIRQALLTHGAGTQAAEQPCDNQRQAVARAFDWARPDGVVLLSPAAPSFGQFRNYKERSADFLAAARLLARVPPGGG